MTARANRRPYGRHVPGAAAKVCTRCGLPRPAGDFHRHPKMRDGLSSWCRACQVENNRKWRADNRDAINAARRVRHEPRACPGCGIVFTPGRSDQRYCCRLCGDSARSYGPRPALWAADHASKRHAAEAPMA